MMKNSNNGIKLSKPAELWSDQADTQHWLWAGLDQDTATLQEPLWSVKCAEWAGIGALTQPDFETGPGPVINAGLPTVFALRKAGDHVTGHWDPDLTALRRRDCVIGYIGHVKSRFLEDFPLINIPAYWCRCPTVHKRHKLWLIFTKDSGNPRDRHSRLGGTKCTCENVWFRKVERALKRWLYFHSWQHCFCSNM